jgi:5'-nucleotidase
MPSSVPSVLAESSSTTSLTPKSPVFVEYVLTRNMKAAVNEDLEYDDTSYANTGDLGLEGFAFVPASQSTTGSAMLIVGNEVSGTVNIFEVK